MIPAWSERDVNLIKDYANRMKIRDIAKKYKLSEGRVCDITRRIRHRTDYYQLVELDALEAFEAYCSAQDKMIEFGLTKDQTKRAEDYLKKKFFEKNPRIFKMPAIGFLFWHGYFLD